MTDYDSEEENNSDELFSDDEEDKNTALKERSEKFFERYRNNSKLPLEFFEVVEDYEMCFKIGGKNKNNKKQNELKNDDNSTSEDSIDFKRKK